MSSQSKSFPEKIWPGKGTACLVSGYITNELPVKDVIVRADADVSSSTLLQLATDHIDDCCAAPSPRNCLLSGYTSLVRFPPVSERFHLPVELQAEFSRNNSQIIDRSTVALLPGNTISNESLSFRYADSGHKIVICMACWEPDPDRFRRQVDSIRAQTIKSWHCIINDDASSDESWLRINEIIGDDSRFSLFRNEKNLGFYANFEVALARVPVDVDFIALADQDDDWYAEKLEKTVQAFDSSTTLAYCDMRIVDEKDGVIAETYWTSRKNSYKDAEVLFLANTVTGAASMFRRDLLDDILPFPQPVGQVFHDHWIACVARCRGDLAYVDQPLYDYYQYGSSVIGHCDFQARGVGQRVKDLVSNVRHMNRPGRLKSWLIHKRHSALNVFHQEYLRLFLFAEILKIRIPSMQSDAAEGLRMFSANWAAIIYLLSAHIRIVFRKETTDDAELRLAASLFMFKLDRIIGRLFGRRIVKRHCRFVDR